MPEGPEARIITDSLVSKLTNRKVIGVSYLGGRYTKHGLPDGSTEFCNQLPHSINEVSCKGKFIYVNFDTGWSLWNTLGMSGGWSDKLGKHSHVKIDLDNGTCIYFNDPRRFGTLKFVNDHHKTLKKLSLLGPDMLSENIDAIQFSRRIRTKPDKTIAEVLMDQAVICGVGNYLKSESLYFAKISPHRICKTLDDNELDTLNSVIQKVIRQSYHSGGATIYTFQSFEGVKGQYTRRFAVYNQDTDPMGRDVESFTSPGGRTTFWVPEEQT